VSVNAADSGIPSEGSSLKSRNRKDMKGMKKIKGNQKRIERIETDQNGSVPSGRPFHLSGRRLR
jgi:hypothetical protein